MDVDVISVGVEGVVEHEGCVHEATRIYKTSPLTNLHFLDIEDKTAVENVESEGALASKEQDLVVGDLVGQAHVGGHPARLVNLGCADLLPHVARDVVHFYRVHDSFLVNSSAKGENVVVFEDSEGSASARHAHISNELPLVLDGVIDLAVAVHLVAHERTNHVDEVLNRADGVVSVRIVHVADLIQDSKKIIVSVAILEIDAHMLDIAASEVNGARFSGN